MTQTIIDKKDYLTINKEGLEFVDIAITTTNIDAKNLDDVNNAFKDVFTLKNLSKNKQIHSNIVNKVDKDNIGQIIDGDAIITNEKNVPLLILTADCVPVVLVDKVNKAVGLVHAGWRGTYGKICSETLQSMKENYNNSPIITISMGKKGMISRMSGEVFGSCLTFASGIKASAPGQIEAKDLKSSLEIIHKYYKNDGRDFNILLIGFMGSGKSSVSLKLSELLKMEVIDTDKYIEKKESKTVDEIFNTYGKKYFRTCETNILKELSKNKNTIISCGGGVILKDENITIMKNQGKVVLLTAKPENIYDRVKNSTIRPLLNNNMTIEYISQLMEDRKEKYLKAADMIIETDDKSIEQICKEIIEQI